jgi:predicted GTPase
MQWHSGSAGRCCHKFGARWNWPTWFRRCGPLDYVTQAKARPPTFVLFCNRANEVPEAHRCPLINTRCQSFDLSSVTIR